MDRKEIVMKKQLLPLVSALLVGIGTFLHADVNMHEGLWKMTVQTEMSGMPMQMAIPETSFTQKDLIPKDQEGKEGKCKVTKQEISGDTINWVMECQDEAKMKAIGSATYHGDTFEGTTDITTVIPQMGTMKMKQKIKGKWIGECKK